MGERLELILRRDMGPIPSRRRGPIEDSMLEPEAVQSVALRRDINTGNVTRIGLSGEVLRGTVGRKKRRSTYKKVDLSNWHDIKTSQGEATLSKRETLIVKVLKD